MKLPVVCANKINYNYVMQWRIQDVACLARATGAHKWLCKI